MSDEGEAERDWADLPPELLHRISKELPDLRDFIRFRAVCPSWCSSAPLSDPPPQQLPWILERLELHPRQKRLHGLGEELRFYSLSTGEIGIIHVDESRQGKSFKGPSCGYLLLCDEYCIIPFNPLTNLHISLPSTEYVYKSQWHRNILPIWTGSDPILSRKIAFMEPFSPPGCWAVYYPEETEWIIHDGFFVSSCYSHGLLFGELGGSTSTIVCDATSTEHPVLYVIEPPEHLHDDHYCQSYLVELSGVVMMVRLYFMNWDQNVEQSVFHIYKLNFQGKDGEPFWVEVSNIADHMLFLDEMNAFSLKPTARLKGNCIYFFYRRGGTPCKYDIMAGTFERISCPFERCSWFVPSLV